MKEVKPTVFVVDDDAAVRDSLRMLLKSVGLPVEVFESGQEFLDADRDDRPGCLVLDIRMPGMSGLELQVKLNERHSILPIIFITGHGDVPMAVEAMQAGAVDFIQKPFRDQDLLDRINQALEKDAGSRRMLAERNMIRKRLESLTDEQRANVHLAGWVKALALRMTWLYTFTCWLGSIATSESVSPLESPVASMPGELVIRRPTAS